MPIIACAQDHKCHVLYHEILLHLFFKKLINSWTASKTTVLEIYDYTQKKDKFVNKSDRRIVLQLRLSNFL
jgi:hypothetical protein